MNIQDKIQEGAGYLTSAGLTSTPLWLEIVSAAQLAGLFVGLFVGLATLYLTCLRIKKLKADE